MEDVNLMKLDEHGCPITDAAYSPIAPPKACTFCAEGNPVAWSGTNWEWCQEFKTCAATIDWEQIYNRR